ncbi:uncharacterized protein LOC115759702 [Drosophila novamexicana]|uniref:uncharacterized protein LOC115759702 n=1 Tax=Drosophila novamexicana TaxID=47314 RepID=UPI0011E5F52F|nr:uncharacterized protein LOC115759702 [Drosophila novamexicana]
MCDPCCGPFEAEPRIPPPCPKSITVQQPPRLICKKDVVFCEKTIPEPMVVNRCRNITIPKVVETTRVIQVPKLIWVSQMVREPRVIYYPSTVPDPYVMCHPKKVCEPREVCQTLLCQPKPQVIDVPAPTEYCCYENGPVGYTASPSCPPLSGNDCCSMSTFGAQQYPMCELPCGPCGP